MIRIEDGRPVLYQWDLNRRVELLNIKPGTEVHFADAYENVNCPVVVSYKENDKVFADIPNIFLQRHGTITAYVYVNENNKAFTEYHVEILVLSRPKPSDYVYTEIEIKRYETLEERIRELEEKGAPGGNVVVDSELSEKSKNPVQNKVVTKEIKQLSGHIEKFSGTIEITDGEPEKENTVLTLNPSSEHVNIYTSEETDAKLEQLSREFDAKLNSIKNGNEVAY